MQFRGLILTTSLAAALCSQGIIAQASPCDAVTAIAAKVAFLQAGFDPIQRGQCGTADCRYPPPVDKSNLNRQEMLQLQAYQNRLCVAFSLANTTFQTTLLSLNRIYIDTDTRSYKLLAWGFRDRANNNTTHIAINSAVLDLLQSYDKPLTDYENFILQTLLKGNVPSNLKYYDAVAIDGSKESNANTDAFAILAILAHEMGHVLWYDAAKWQCDYYYFYANTWPSFTVPPGFHELGQEWGNTTFDKPDVFEVQQADSGNAATDIAKIYSGHWASLFATTSLDEDFVETYKLWVLTQASPHLEHLWVRMPAGVSPIDVVANFTVPNASYQSLNAKGNWVDTRFNHYRLCSGGW
jgi:hypothetical protein